MFDKIVTVMVIVNLDYFAGCRIDFGFYFSNMLKIVKTFTAVKLEFQNRIVIVMNCLH